MLLQTSLFEEERTVERDEDEVSWLKQDIRDNGDAAGDGDDRVAATAMGVVVVVVVVDVELAKLPIKSSLHQPA